MATVQIDIPDAQVQRVLDAFAGKFGWVDQATSGTKAAFAKAQVAMWVKRTVLDYEREQATIAAMQAVQDPTVVDVT